MDKAGLDRAIQAEHANISAIVVVEHGATVYENYFNGAGAEDPVHVASVTKSVLSALVGIAIQQGLIQSVDQSVLDFFPEYPAPPDDPRRTVTLRHMLTMTAPYTYEQEPFWEVMESPDWAKFALDLLDGPAPGPFCYSTVGTHLVSVILSRATGRCARAFANETLFGPLGIKELPGLVMTEENALDMTAGRCGPGWVSDPQGNTVGGWGLILTARDLARFGLLYLGHGAWEGKQLVPAAWVEASTTSGSGEYGYFWWLFEDCFCALGDGGNAVCCFPERDLVVAIASQYAPEPGDRLALIRDHILR